MSLIKELLIESVNDTVSIEALLRKAYLVSNKLDLNDFSEFLKKEMHGYNDNDDISKIPYYRLVKGTLIVLNPISGWRPVVIEDKELEKIISSRWIMQSAFELNSLYESKSEELSIRLSGEMNQKLSSLTGVPTTQFCISISRASICHILNSVKTSILEWALTLDKEGIVGDGIDFTFAEINKANESPQVCNYINNFYSSIESSQIQQGTKDSDIKFYR